MSTFPTQPYKGTRDFYPDASDSFVIPQDVADFRKHQYIFDTWRKTLQSLGFGEYDASVIENAEIYLAKSGEELGSKQLYSFHDKGDRHIALRPEMTPTLARLVANKFGELKFPLRWFSIPNCFRYEQPQKGRLREHWQLNVDMVGLEAGPADLELLFFLTKVLKAVCATREMFSLRFNHRGVLDLWISNNGLGERREAIYHMLDNAFKVEPDISEALGDLFTEELSLRLNSLMRVPDSDPKYLEEYVELACSSYPEIRLIVDQVKAHNSQSILGDFQVELDPRIVRGISYYTGVVFEAFDTNPANPRALFGGGRYDNLMELYGKAKTPAIGFGMGDVVIGEFLTNWGLWPDFEAAKTPKVGLMPFSDEDLVKIYMEIIPKLRSEGKTWDIDYDFDRAEAKRWTSLKKRGCEEIVKLR